MSAFAPDEEDRSGVIAEIFEKDVLLGRGNFAIDRAGNRDYRRLLEDNCEAYVKCKGDLDKRLFSVSIVAAAKRCGRFLKPAQRGSLRGSKEKKAYVEISDAKARVKVAQVSALSLIVCALGLPVLPSSPTIPFSKCSLHVLR